MTSPETEDVCKFVDGHHCISCSAVVNEQAIRKDEREKIRNNHKKFCKTLDNKHCDNCFDAGFVWRGEEENIWIKEGYQKALSEVEETVDNLFAEHDCDSEEGYNDCEFCEIELQLKAKIKALQEQESKKV